MAHQKYSIFLAAGGTGGHIFPAQALANILTKHGYNVVCVTDKRHQFFNDTVQAERIDIRPFSSNVIQLCRWIYSLGVSFLQVRKLFLRDKPKILVTFGGYTILPAVIVAILRGVPIVVHEQNAVLGKMNRLIASIAKLIAVAYDDTVGIPPECKGKVVVVGNPVREDIKSLRHNPFPHTDNAGILRILVIGGSQGARILSNVVPQAVAKLEVSDKKQIYIEQQCRAEDVERVTKIYSHINVAASVTSFFNDVGIRLTKAHLVISRAGASFLSELTTVGRPAILVPFAEAADGHQLANAGIFKEKNAAVVLEEKEFTADILMEYLKTFIRDKKPLEEMARNAAGIARTDADDRLANVVEQVLHAAMTRVSGAELKKSK